MVSASNTLSDGWNHSGIAEMEPQNDRNFVRLDSELDEFGMRRAFTGVNQNNSGVPAMEALTDRDRAVFDTMLVAMGEAARIWDPNFAATPNRNPLGTTHHEAGTLWMGDDPRRSVTNPDGRFHLVSNAFAGDLAVAPTSGSAKPMLPGVALARRLAKHLVPEGDGRLADDTQPPKPVAMPRPVALLCLLTTPASASCSTAPRRPTGERQARGSSSLSVRRSRRCPAMTSALCGARGDATGLHPSA